MTGDDGVATVIIVAWVIVGVSCAAATLAYFVTEAFTNPNPWARKQARQALAIGVALGLAVGAMIAVTALR